MYEIAATVVHHVFSTDGWVIITNALVAHVGWRALPEEHKHHVRRAVRSIRGRGADPTPEGGAV